ncbi:MAG: alanine--glyoxylate aminotransferase family protein [Candidatus Dormibacteraeota bacterium]|uniref:Tritium exchange subunit n=1 Tax=Candidatus Dormiibacter inghamiae TaxID=3127013 RepID=A0A934NBQ8_9BACT|nr:alanine--glyoxylate aminotransferase family protein [Candidatus Dormibacteraeota bacterium]MBJ7605748.1 alanine--glyoxylate aminotransferase family protein [Candidatus Dormibacteraeota bacterium]
MTFQQQLRIPGPSPLPERVIRAAAKPMIDHRGPEFAELLADVTAGLKRVFETDNDLVMLTSSGSGGLESAVANLVSPGDKVVCCVCGNFGERFAGLADAFGCRVARLEAEWGQPIDPDDLSHVLSANPDAGVVFITHNETSTALTNNLPALSRVVREHGRLSVVDGVSSIASMPIEVDALGLDVAVSASQKGWMAAPGVAFVSISQRAWEFQSRARSPRYYFDWAEAKKQLVAGSTPFTPAISVIYGLQEGILMLEEEGLANVYARHRRLATATAAGLAELGFGLFAAEGYRSATVTGAVAMTGLDVAAFRTLLRERYGLVIAGGQGKMTGKMVRVGHLGFVNDGDVVQGLWAMENALDELDIAPADGRALAAAARHLAGEPAGAAV